jgi:succinate-acetate transporter protein
MITVSKDSGIARILFTLWIFYLLLAIRERTGVHLSAMAGVGQWEANFGLSRWDKEEERTN